METPKPLYNSLSILESITDAVIVHDINGKIFYVNGATNMLLGYSPSELISKQIEIIFPPLKVNENIRLTESLLRNENVENYETTLMDKQGRIINVSVSLSAIKGEDCKITGITKVIRDITDKKKAEGKFQAFLESAPDAMIIVNKFGEIVLANAQTEKLFEYKREEIINKKIETLIPDRYNKIHSDHRKSFFHAPRTRGMGSGFELYGRKKDGSEFPVEISLSPIETEEGLLVSAAIRDISEQKKVSSALKEYATRLETSNKELEQYAYVASHDLQEPLRNIINYVSLLQQGLKGKLDDDLNYFLTVITQSSEKMSILISDLLHFSRIGSKKVKIPVDCNLILNEILSEMDSKIKAGEATISVAQLPSILANPTELKQVFQNLISNAIKFRRKDIKLLIDINYEERKKDWRFSVADNGIGIRKEYLNKIFLLFQRLHTESEYPGTGIGLTTCRKIIEQNGGEISVQSTEGMGSTFFFTLPKR